MLPVCSDGSLLATRRRRRARTRFLQIASPAVRYVAAVGPLVAPSLRKHQLFARLIPPITTHAEFGLASKVGGTASEGALGVPLASTRYQLILVIRSSRRST